MGESGDFFLKIFDRKNLPKELVSFFGITEPESLNAADVPDEQESRHSYPKGGELPDNRIIIETGIGKNKKRYILPATPESYGFLKQLETECEISPEKSAILKMMEGMNQEEIKAMFDFLSANKSNPAGT